MACGQAYGAIFSFLIGPEGPRPLRVPTPGQVILSYVRTQQDEQAVASKTVSTQSFSTAAAPVPALAPVLTSHSDET